MKASKEEYQLKIMSGEKTNLHFVLYQTSIFEFYEDDKANETSLNTCYNAIK